MRKKIFLAIFFTSFSFIFLSLVFLLFLFDKTLQKQAFYELEEEFVFVENNLEKILKKEFFINNYRITLLLNNGEVVFDNFANSLDNHLNRFEIQNALKNDYAISSRFSNSLKKDSFYLAKKIIFKQEEFILRLSSDKENINTLIKNTALFLLIIFIFSVCVCILIANFLSKQILKPLKNLDLNNPSKDRVYKELHDFIDKIEENNENTKRLRVEFTHNVTHELKTPLTSIMLSSEMLKNNMVKKEDESNFINLIYNQSCALLVMIDEIIKISFLEQNKDIKKLNIRIDLLLLKIIKDLEFKLKEKNINIKTKLIKYSFLCNESLLYTMLFNLIENAIKYNNDNGIIDIKMYERKDILFLSIKDSGIGIKKEFFDRIYERFFRICSSRSKEIEGTGLGLSIVKKIAKIHKIKIKLISAENEGSEFILRFKKF